MKSQKHKLLDTNSVFYSNIDKLIIVIETTLSKGQIKNAEKYLKYFFEVMVVSYSRISLIKNDRLEFQYNANVTNITETTDARIEITEAKTRFGRRLILQEGPESYYDDKIQRLIFKNIKPNNYDVFRFIFSLYQDSIISLLKSDNTYKNAFWLIRHIPLIASQIISYEHDLSLRERDWFHSVIIEWFMSTYGSAVDTTEKIIPIQFEMLRVLQVYIDNDRVDLYKYFLNRLSSSLLMHDNHYYNNEAINKYLNDLDKVNWKIRYDILDVQRQFNGLSAIEEFNSHITLFENKIKDIHLKYGVEVTTATYEFISSNKALNFQEFKSNYVRILLIKSIVYSFFKKTTEYLDTILSYHQPKDADATWVGDNFGKFGQNDIKFMLLNRDEIIERDWFFRIDHHGFEVYLNTLIGYLLVKNYLQSKQPITLHTATDTYGTLKQLEYQLERVKINYVDDILKRLFPDTNIAYQEILTEYIERISDDANRKEVIELESSQFDEVKIAEFKEHYVEKFYTSAFVRKVFSINSHINFVKSINKETERGINTIVPKRIYINQTDVYVDPKDFADTYARSAAESENINLTIDIESKCTRIKLKAADFKQFLIENKDKYDIILQTGESYTNRFPDDMNFTYAWTIKDSLYNGINEYLGVLDNHFHVFSIYGYPVNKFILLKSNNLGYINQYMSESFENGFYEDIFSFSIINLGQEEEDRKRLISGSNDPNMTEDYLKKGVWLRIFESYEYESGVNFSGISIEIDG